MKALFRDIITTFLVAAVVFFLMQATLQVSIIDGSSMEPDLQAGQRLLINKAVYRILGEPERGEVVVFEPPERRTDAPFIKRIIGLPGERVEVIDGQVLVNGSPLYEPYIKEPPN